MSVQPTPCAIVAHPSALVSVSVSSADALRPCPLSLDSDVNTINTWAEPRNANGITPNTVIDSNDSPPGNNQQRMKYRGY